MYLIGTQQQFPLPEGTIVIGRAHDAAVRIDSGGVSRHHARIVVRGDEARVEDLGSKNGTFVGGEPVTGTRLLNDGDEIRVGPVALTFSVATPTQVTETVS
jgi:pSer/pThr/pTyr-binding forkhead associated (FHA) protein